MIKGLIIWGLLSQMMPGNPGNTSRYNPNPGGLPTVEDWLIVLSEGPESERLTAAQELKRLTRETHRIATRRPDSLDGQQARIQWGILSQHLPASCARGVAFEPDALIPCAQSLALIQTEPARITLEDFSRLTLGSREQKVLDKALKAYTGSTP